MQKIVFATGNRHKLKEVRNILSKLGIEVLSKDDVGLLNFETIESGQTFEENATKKALEIYNIVKIPVLGDDSGLCVDALGGAPGIYSSRYSGEDSNDRRNIDKLLAELEPYKTKEERSARFVCAMALYGFEDKPIITRGESLGYILHEREGINGFGYDPVFFFPPLGKSYAQLSEDEKNSVSHRSKALQKMYEYLSSFCL